MFYGRNIADILEITQKIKKYQVDKSSGLKCVKTI